MRTLLNLVAFLVFASAQAQINAEVSTQYNTAVKLMSEKNYLEAKEILDQVLLKKPDYAESIFARGLCFLMLNEREESCKDFQKAKNLNWQPANEYMEKFCGKDAIGRQAKPLELQGE
jgi:tetratricopeptide (TPR) repeat protein